MRLGFGSLLNFVAGCWTLADGDAKHAAKQDGLSFITLTSSKMAARPWMIRTQKFYAGRVTSRFIGDPRPRRQ